VNDEMKGYGRKRQLPILRLPEGMTDNKKNLSNGIRSAG
jgi:hypothetical protein